MSMADYTPGGGLSPQDISYTGQCAQKCVCDTLDKGLSAITYALTQIDNTIEKYLGKKCQIVDDCKDEIIRLIEDTYNTTVGTCDDCKADLAAGLGGTVEFAVRCAGACIDEIEKKTVACSLTNEGEPCTTCGQQPCCCTQGVCEPCEQQEQQPKHKYQGWCNSINDQAFANRDDEPVPDGDGWNLIGLFDSEQVALEAGQSACQQSRIGEQPTQNAPDVSGPTGPCNILSFVDGTLSQSIIDASAGLNIAAGVSDEWDKFRKLGFEGINFGNVADILYGAVRANTAWEPYLFTQIAPRAMNAIGCQDNTFRQSVLAISSFGLIDHLLGTNLSEFATTYRYQANAQCRIRQSTSQQALAAYLTNAIDVNQLDAHYAIEGLCKSAADEDIHARQTRPNAQQLATMRHRGIIDDATYQRTMRENGYLNTAFVSWTFDTSYAVPDAQSVYHYLQQGALTGPLIDKLGLNEGYDQLVGGQFGEWLKANGIKPEQALADWQSHWTTPNLGSLFEFLHRLQDNDELGGKAGIESDVQSAMSSLGIPPYWRKFYMAVAYTPLLKRDIRLAYTSGALSDDDLPKALRVTGHDADAVDTLVKELKPARRHAILNHAAIRLWVEQIIDAEACKGQLSADGYSDDAISQGLTDSEHHFSRSSWADAYGKGLIDRNAFIELLAAWGVSPAGCTALANKLAYHIVDHQYARNYIAGGVTRQNALAGMVSGGMVVEIAQQSIRDADDAIINSLHLECVRGIKHRYLTGEITKDETYDLMVSRGIDSYRAKLLSDNFDCERSAAGRAIPVEKLCHWLYIGAISQSDFLDRALRLGYTEENAAMLLFDCVQANTLRQIKEANAAAKQLQSDADKRQRAADKAEATRKRDAERAAKLRSAKAKLRATREKQLLVASEKVYSLSNADLATSLATVRDSVAQIATRYGMTQDEALRLAVVVSDNFKGHEIVDFPVMMDQLAADAVAGVPEPSDDDLGVLPSTNGDTQPSGPTSPLG